MHLLCSPLDKPEGLMQEDTAVRRTPSFKKTLPFKRTLPFKLENEDCLSTGRLAVSNSRPLSSIWDAGTHRIQADQSRS
jgi:hypothetical protein